LCPQRVGRSKRKSLWADTRDIALRNDVCANRHDTAWQNPLDISNGQRGLVLDDFVGSSAYGRRSGA
jgi:hypothetical protein